MNCHAVTRTDKPEIQRLTAAFKAGQPIEWQRVYTLPDHVYFDHRPHVGAGIAARVATGKSRRWSRYRARCSCAWGRACLAPRRARGPCPQARRLSRTHQLLRVPPMKPDTPPFNFPCSAPSATATAFPAGVFWPCSGLGRLGDGRGLQADAKSFGGRSVHQETGRDRSRGRQLLRQHLSRG